MAATTAGAVKAYLEGLRLGVPVFRDEPPAGQDLPYITVREIANVPDRDGDHGDPTAVRTTSETVQISVWQTWRNPTTGRVVEDYLLPQAVARAVRSAGLDASPTRTYGVLLQSSVRLLERDRNVVQHALTAVVRRAL